MPKYYVKSGRVELVLQARNAREAAIKAFQWSCDSRDSLQAPESFDAPSITDADGWDLGEGIRVSEHGFDRPDARVFDTLDIIPVWQGYAFPWC